MATPDLPDRRPLLLTLDSDVCIDLDEGSTRLERAEAVAALVALAEAGTVDLARAGDLLRHREWPRGRTVEEIEARDANLDGQGVGEVGSPMRWDVSRWDEGVWGGPTTSDLDPKLRGVLGVELPAPGDDLARFDKAVSDVDHLLAHALADRDVFVSWNVRDLVRRGRREDLAALGVVVATPAEVVDALG